jgi:GNAT superfamily N-acetyltransferase
MITFRTFSGPAAIPYFDDLARLRLEVFRAFPYLYEGSRDYERDYLSKYARSPGALFVLAFDDGKVVGASTGMPMVGETNEVKAPFIVSGFNTDEFFYFGESVLLPGYRGRGIGVRFFDERETYAARLPGIRYCTFCAVERPDDHPRRPPDYVPLDTFWKNRGYAPMSDLRTSFSWRDIDETAESPKPMAFWLKEFA